MNSIHQIIFEFAEKVMNPNILKDGLSEGLKQFEDHVKELAQGLFPALIEKVDQTIAENKADRPGWRIVHKDVARTLQSKYGALNFKRRYYYHGEQGYAYLCDDVLSIEAYERVERGLGLELVKQATQMSYTRSAKECAQGAVSPTGVMNLIRRIDLQPPEYEANRDDVPIVHIQADEDHIHLQQESKRSSIIKLIAIHEPKQVVSANRHALTNRHLIAQLDGAGIDIWDRTGDYLCAVYPTQEPKVFIHGDGAAWIARGLEEIPNSIAILDLFHLKQRIQRLCMSDGRLMNRLFRCIQNDDQSKLREEVEMLVNSDICTEEAGAEFLKYLTNHWQAALANFTMAEVHGGSCAEGLVSHMLSKRFSRDPMGWSKQSIKPLVELKMRLCNGESFGTDIFDKKTIAPKTRQTRVKIQETIGVPGFGKLAQTSSIPGSESVRSFYHTLSIMGRNHNWN